MDKVLVTCPPMLGQLAAFNDLASSLNLELVGVKTRQVLSETELVQLVPNFDGWIIGDDPASRLVFESGVAGRLRAAVKWGVGVDNVDFSACRNLGVPISNTPNMFGGEVADIAIGLMIGVARQTFLIDREVRRGDWPKPTGTSIAGKHVGVVGFGDIGLSLVNRLAGFDVTVTCYDPGVDGDQGFGFVKRKTFPDGLNECDFLVFTCALTDRNFHMLNAKTLEMMKRGSYVINVARGPLIDEQALISYLQTGHIAAAGLDVLEIEPPSVQSPLLKMPQCILGSHNGSNTYEAVERATVAALEELAGFLRGE